jgi:hypothetical protein
LATTEAAAIERQVASPLTMVLAGVSIGLAVLLQRADRAITAGVADSGAADPEAYRGVDTDR